LSRLSFTDSIIQASSSSYFIHCKCNDREYLRSAVTVEKEHYQRIHCFKLFIGGYATCTYEKERIWNKSQGDSREGGNPQSIAIDMSGKFGVFISMSMIQFYHTVFNGNFGKD
jgi:hypothetical protein